MGAINVKHTGAGADIALSSDGTSLLLDGTAIGGGGAALELYAENPSSPTTNTVTGSNAVAIGSNATASGSNSFAGGVNTTASSTGSFVYGRNATSSGADSLAFGYAALASGSSSISIGSNTDATQNSSVAIGNGSQATSAYSFAAGRNSSGAASVATSGNAATALGGSYASGTDSFAAAIANNTSSYGATGANSVAMGLNAQAQGNQSVSIGTSSRAGSYAVSIGRRSRASGNFSVSIAAAGYSIASGNSSIVIGSGCDANVDYAVSLGFDAQSDTIGKYAYASGKFSGGGDAQTGTFVFRSDTTDATPEALTTDNSAAGTTNQVILPNNSAFAFSGTIVARQQASQGTASAAWKVEGLIRREGSAGTTVLVNSATTVLDNTPAWGMALTADTTNGGLAITVTGAASTNVRFVATINTSEVTY